MTDDPKFGLDTTDQAKAAMLQYIRLVRFINACRQCWALGFSAIDNETYDALYAALVKMENASSFLRDEESPTQHEALTNRLV